MSEPLPIAKAGNVELALLPGLANRHGLITGATGPGKTVTLRHAPCPVVFWDVFGVRGHPIRATVSDLGPLLLARLLQLNDTQEGVLNLVFKIADDAGLLLLDLKDLRAMLQHVGDHAAEFTT